MIAIQLLGGASLRDGDAPLVGPPAQRHRIALLALVVATWPQPLSRDRAMALLWPERDSTSARRLLNLATHVLRVALGAPTIASVSAGDALLFGPAHVECDLHALRTAIASADHESVVRLYTGAFLDGFHLPDSPEFGYWLDEHRAELAHAHIGALLALAERQERAGAVHEWVGTGRKLVAADPHAAKYAIALMRALDAAGDRASALQHAREHAQRMREELELEPDVEVAAFAERLRSAPAVARVPIAATTTSYDGEVAQLLARGRHLWNKRTEPSLRAALECFQQVIDRDPLQGKAWIGVADSLNMLCNYGFAPPGDSAFRARAAAARAIELQGESADAMRALALAAWQFDFAWDEAERLYRRALEIDPSNAITHHWYGVLLGVTARFDESLDQFQQAERLDPLSFISLATRAWFTIFAGRPEEAHVILRRVLSMDSAYFPAHWYDGQALAALGRNDEAVSSFTRAIELAGRTSRLLGYLGYALGQAGRADEARALLDELARRSAEDYVPPYFRAVILAGLGACDEALDDVARALESRDTMVRDLAVDTPWWSYRDHERYRALVGQMGLAVRRS